MAQISKEELGDRIRRLRVKNNKSQEDLGNALDKSHATVSDIERGKTELSVTDLAKIAQFFDVPVEILVSPEAVSVAFSFSHSRAELGMGDEEKKEILKAREEFRKKAREMQGTK
jgi:transcriptional regulator with XRE-family HTH domain